MLRTESGIDIFKLSWQVFSEKIVNTTNSYTETTWLFKRYKREDESLEEFFSNNQDEIILPKYLINDTDLASWMNLNWYQGKIIDYPGHLINPLFIFSQGGYKHLPSLKSVLYQLLGHKVDLEKFRKLGFLIDEINLDWSEAVEEDNRSIMLYSCGCGDRDCGYFPLIINLENNLISWDIGSPFRKFIFDYNQYKSEFKEYLHYLDFQPNSI